MRTETQTVRIGENMGPIDWTHPTAKHMPQFWREAEANPDEFRFQGRTILAIAMYDGWPYWTPRPAIQFIGPLNSSEWTFFNSYGVHAGSIDRMPREAMSDPMTTMYADALALVDRKIVCSHVFPPIPCRDYDWSAHFDDLGADCSPYGWGRTEAEAKQDLLDNCGEDE